MSQKLLIYAEIMVKGLKGKITVPFFPESKRKHLGGGTGFEPVTPGL